MTFYECITYYDDVAINGIPIEALRFYVEQFPQIFTAAGKNRIDLVMGLCQECNLRFKYGEHQSYLTCLYDDEMRESLGLPELHIISWESLDDMSISEEDLNAEDLF